MGLILDGRSMNSPLCQELMSKYQDDMVRQSSVPALMTLSVEQAFIDYDSRQHRCKPYLLLIGRPVSFEGEFPHRVTKVKFQETLDRTPLAYRYDFNDENLADLARKGLFNEESDFEVPPIISNNQGFELPCRVNCSSFPSQGQNLPPVIFLSVDPSSLHCDDSESGYTINEYFEMAPSIESQYNAQRDERENQHESHTAVFDQAFAEAAVDYQGAVPMKQLDKPIGMPVTQFLDIKPPVPDVSSTGSHHSADDVQSPDVGPDMSEESEFI